MNPLINAYQYKINQLKEEIVFLQRQNNSIRLILEDPIIGTPPGGGGSVPVGPGWPIDPTWVVPETPSGNPNLPTNVTGQRPNPFTFPGSENYLENDGMRTRGRWLQKTFKKFMRGVQFDMEWRPLWAQIEQYIRQMNPEQWNKFLELIRDGAFNDVTDLRTLLDALRRPNISRHLNPTRWQRFARHLKRILSTPTAKRTILLAILLGLGYATWRAYGFETEEDYLRAVEEWYESGNEGIPPWADPNDPIFQDLPEGEVTTQEAPEAPSMLPNSNPATTPERFPGGMRPEPIDPGTLEM
jgi:hypothetical protein